ncbi:MAG: DHH family phosphoesterase [Oscillospiraceae bacterium]
MKKNKTHVFDTGFRLSFVLLAVFAIITALLKEYALAVAEGAAAALCYLGFLRHNRRRQKALAKFMNSLTGDMDVAAKDAMVNSPLPMVIFRPESGEIIWTNDRFLHLTGRKEHLFDTRLDGLVEDFPIRWLMEGKAVCPQEVRLGLRRFQVYGHLVRTDELSRSSGYLATTYWVDVTELAKARDAFVNTRPVVALLVLDNYDEVLKPMSDSARSALLSEINNRMDAWVAGSGGLFCRVDRDRYLFVFEERYLQDYMDAKFSILDEVRQASCAEGGPVTLSIGLGRGADTFDELYHYASLSVEMALSRGGDQAVVRNKVGFEFYGGHTKELEKRTKVKSRVMANALRALVTDSNAVMVMGHKMADMDAVGAAAGVCALCRKLNVPCYVIKEAAQTPGQAMVERLSGQEYYKTRFINPQEALVAADSSTLLVVVDTNRPDQVISGELLEACTKVAVIDHHRRAAEYIEGAALNFHEPFASSACELVTELLQYQLDSADLFRVEAEALLGGVMLDTKNFTMRTGGRTFEAAAFLRRAGADTAEVKKLFQTDLSGTIAKYDLIRNATLYREGVALAAADHSVGRVTASQAADELLNISGIDCSFVVYAGENGVSMISARSNGSTNVQVILETLGGGGNAAVAGAQLPGCTVDEVVGMLKIAIDRYFEEN